MVDKTQCLNFDSLLFLTTTELIIFENRIERLVSLLPDYAELWLRDVLNLPGTKKKTRRVFWMHLLCHRFCVSSQATAGNPGNLV